MKLVNNDENGEVGRLFQAVVSYCDHQLNKYLGSYGLYQLSQSINE